MLTDALLELMDTNDYHKITITEIVQQAQVARKTFYRHFTSKDEILNIYIQTLFQQYMKRLGVLKEFNEYEAVLTYFQFWKDHLTFVDTLIKSNMAYLILIAFEDYLPVIDEKYQHSQMAHSENYEYAITFSSGGFWHLLCKWVHNGAKETPEEMTDYYFNFCQ